MNFNIAKKLILEIDRTTSKLAFISLISGDNDKFFREFNGEEIVNNDFEYGTMQSYYNYKKILLLIQKTNFKIKWCRLIAEEGINHRYKYSRYYLVMEK